MIIIILNGQKYTLTRKITLIELIKYLDYKHTLFILEYNQMIYNKKDWETISLKNNDRIEIVTIVGGG